MCNKIGPGESKDHFTREARQVISRRSRRGETLPTVVRSSVIAIHRPPGRRPERPDHRYAEMLFGASIKSGRFSGNLHRSDTRLPVPLVIAVQSSALCSLLSYVCPVGLEYQRLAIDIRDLGGTKGRDTAVESDLLPFE